MAPTDVVSIMFELNGVRRRCDVSVRMHAADFIRQEMRLTGTHVGCEQGVCGMCTIEVDGMAVKSCLMLAAQLDGRKVNTVESLASEGELHPSQRIFREEHGLQCGFCTPGFLMTLKSLKESGRHLDEDELKAELAGVLCRCTGYTNILRAARRILDEDEVEV